MFLSHSNLYTFEDQIGNGMASTSRIHDRIRGRMTCHIFPHGLSSGSRPGLGKISDTL